MALAAALRVKAACNRLFSEALKIRCATRLQALDSMHESASYSDHSMRPALCIRASGSSAGSFLLWQRLLSMVRRLLRWSGLRLLSELLRLRRLLSAFLAASILRRVLWRLARARLGSWTGRGSWTRRRLARSSLIRSNRCQMPLALQVGERYRDLWHLHVSSPRKSRIVSAVGSSNVSASKPCGRTLRCRKPV
jgi:hypothetical protein